MSAAEYASWCTYASLEPFGSEAQDWYQAHLASVLANIHRDVKRQSNAFEMGDFVLFHRVHSKHPEHESDRDLSAGERALLQGFKRLQLRQVG
ncbi:MAG: hypothetical protein RLY65_2122 [Pseudomonadota bacterium]